MWEDEEHTSYLLEFFKALADENRLRIVGLLARQDYSIEELSALLDLKATTVLRHLHMLQKVGLVQARVAQHEQIYSLRLQGLHEMSQKILSREALQETARELDLDDFDRKVLRDFMTEGRLKSIPSQSKKRDVILRYLAEQFEPDRLYTEKEVNEILSRAHEDYAALRRYLVDGLLLAREHDIYWRVEQE